MRLECVEWKINVVQMQSTMVTCICCQRNQSNKRFFPVKELTKETEKKTSLENDTSLFHWNITESDRTVCVFNFQVYRCVPCIRFY